MSSEFRKTINTLIAREHLPPGYKTTVATTIVPLVEAIVALQKRQNRPVIVGIHGAQGTGKSTLALFLSKLLRWHWHCPAVSLSLDDFYLTRDEREHLARSVHPLLATRGVPGSHDLALGNRVLDQLLAARPGDITAIPSFDKATDDRVPEADWPVFEGPAKVILLEGWCLGATPQREPALINPVNALEANEDPEGLWRRYVNECLETGYRSFFHRLDWLVMLKAPSMECVLQWRRLQEQKLAQRYAGAPGLRIMSDNEVQRFVMHYQRVTEHCLRELPARADVLIPVGEDHIMEAPVWNTRN
ncbi:glycerate kinase [Marinobacter persicus]|uniref:Glycerate kinase n=1 Tax=Marinobacter persicus TaxID=930118 RepID=A0A1I3P8S6_9GAMM|nr:hypothetical protein [Marinobacter persicus]GHD51296.1 kinase [Marinobacter persicus]SFJ17842.1 glycerate kinase [Marinobacter persicus]